MNTNLPPARQEQDNLLGVCAAIAEVTGLPALAVRLAMVLAMFAISFKLVLIGYGLAAIAIQLADGPIVPRLRRLSR